MKIYLFQIIVISLIIGYLFNLFTGVQSTESYHTFPILLVVDSIFTALTIILLSKNRYSFLAILIPYALLIFLYAPTGLRFGYLDFYYIYSLFATNTAESVEYISSITWPIWLATCSFIILLFLNRILIHKYNYPNTKNTLITFITISFIWIGYKGLINTDFPTPTFVKTPKDILSNTIKLYKEVRLLRSLENNNSQWTINSINPKYKNYILVIGESQRRDYMNMYGFPYENTPFMSSSGTTVEGLTAAGFNTISSLQYMLTNTAIEEEIPNYAENFIDLANTADFETIWISNQGTYGESDTPIAFIAKRSTKNFFIKSGRYNISNEDDFKLIPIFKKELETKINKHRLFVIHIMGSHPIPSERIINYPKKIAFNKNQDVEDYLNSIHKTDSLIKIIFDVSNQEFRKDQNESFSILYFSDHGLKYYAENETNSSGDKVKQTGFNVSSDVKEIYEIPLFKISSDDYDKKHIKATKYGKNFTRGLANWLGIDSKQIKNKMDLFAPQNDSIIDNSLRLEDKKNNPVIN